MRQALTFTPGQAVVVKDTKSASAVGYIGTRHNVGDHVKYSDDGEPIYLCKSENGHYTWFYESELRSVRES